MLRPRACRGELAEVQRWSAHQSPERGSTELAEVKRRVALQERASRIREPPGVGGRLHTHRSLALPALWRERRADRTRSCHPRGSGEIEAPSAISNLKSAVSVSASPAPLREIPPPVVPLVRSSVVPSSPRKRQPASTGFPASAGTGRCSVLPVSCPVRVHRRDLRASPSCLSAWRSSSPLISR